VCASAQKPALFLGTLEPESPDNGSTTTKKGNTMNAKSLVAVALLVAGIVGLLYGGFSYTKDTTVAKLGSVEISAQEQKSVDFPLWASVGAVVAGGLLLAWGGRKS
jgi:hypothetical protein